MMALLSPRVWIAVSVVVLLAGTHWKAYVSGGRETQAKWDAQTISQAKAQARAVDVARAKEAEVAAKLRKANDDYQREKKARLAAVADLDRGLRDFRDSLYSLSRDPAASRIDGAGDRELLGQCADALTGLAKEADRLSGKVTGLQGYISAR